MRHYFNNETIISYAFNDGNTVINRALRHENRNKNHRKLAATLMRAATRSQRCVTLFKKCIKTQQSNETVIHYPKCKIVNVLNGVIT